MGDVIRGLHSAQSEIITVCIRYQILIAYAPLQLLFVPRLNVPAIDFDLAFKCAVEHYKAKEVVNMQPQVTTIINLLCQ